MDEFVIEKYIKIRIGISTGIINKYRNKCMLIQILTLIVLQYNRKDDRKHVRLFIAKDITKKITLACSSS